MSYFIKKLVQKAYEQKFEDVNDFVVIDTTGISGIENNVMRGDLKEKGVYLTVVKNSQMRRALQAMDMEAAINIFETGPCTLVYGGDSVVDAAKEIVDWAKKVKAIDLKGAYVDGTVMDDKGVKELSKMPTRTELQGQVVQLALTPGSNVAGALAGPGGVIAGCLKSLIEKLEEAA